MFWRKKERHRGSFPDILCEQQRMMGQGLHFAAAEAYKLLRTNLMFSFPGEDPNAKIIGVTSSLKGEGKSLTAINLGYTIAQAGKTVLIVECDLRLPSIARRLKLQPSLGLSDLLVGLCPLEQILRQDVLTQKLDVIPAGTIPPNAAELLESERMRRTLAHLAQYYDYILLDLPPVMVVSDALIVSKLTSGMLVVVRDQYAEKTALAQTMRQLKFVNAKVLGFVLNAAQSTMDSDRKYRRKYGYSRYSYEEKAAQRDENGRRGRRSAR